MSRQSASSYVLTLAAFAALMISGCHADSLIEELRDTKDKVCQCPDKTCVEALQSSSQKFEKRLLKLSAAEQKKVQAIALEMMACVQQI